MPSSRQARWMRSAISPRLAIRTLSKSLSGLRAAMRMPCLSDEEQRLPEFHRLAVFGEDRLDRAARVRLDFVHQLHRLDDAQRIALRDGGADFDKRCSTRRRGSIERADHRALHGVSFVDGDDD